MWWQKQTRIVNHVKYFYALKRPGPQISVLLCKESMREDYLLNKVLKGGFFYRKVLFWPTFYSNKDKNKNKHMRHKLKTFCKAKETINKTKKRTPRINENISKRSIWQSINFQNKQSNHVSQYERQKNKQPNQKLNGKSK